MNALIYNPYWDSLGGGEKYTATFIDWLLKNYYTVDVATLIDDLAYKIDSRFDLDIKKININKNAFKILSTGNLMGKYLLMKKYDVIFWISDGSIPMMFGKKNFLHFQVPFKLKFDGMNARLKRSLISKVVCNSNFTKQVVDKTYSMTSEVLYPPSTIHPQLKKEKLILTVGRLDESLNSKRQDVLIKTFCKQDWQNWKLVVAGGAMKNANLSELKSLIKDKNVEIIPNPSFDKLSELYGAASIYWHAAGYGSDPDLNPEKAEHFGISTVEAMSTGAIPVAFNAGGQREIITHGQNGFLWNSTDQLVEYTNDIIGKKAEVSNLSAKAAARALDFSENKFYESVKKIVG